MKQIRIFLLLAVLVFAWAALGHGTASARSCERASGATVAATAGCPRG